MPSLCRWKTNKLSFPDPLVVEACPGTSAALPCPSLSTTGEDDVAVFWYKDEAVSPFYMVDARGAGGGGIARGTHRRLSPLGARAAFDAAAAGVATLRLDVESRDDAGTYVCRVDSYRSLTRTSTVLLKVLAPTPKLVIYEGEKELPDVAGPYNEGSDLELSCVLTAGGEEEGLQVLWLVRGEVVDATFEALPGGKMHNQLSLKGLDRGLHLQPITCLAAHSPHDTTPFLQTDVHLDMFLHPLGARISPSPAVGREGSPLELTCRAWGSVPAPLLSWRLGRQARAEGGGGRLRLPPLAPSDHGRQVTCLARNPRLPDGDGVADSLLLNVTFSPKVSLSLKTFSSGGGAVSEGDTVALACKVWANPGAGVVRWAFAPEYPAPSVGQQDTAPPGEGPPTLVLERLQPWHKGSYRCSAANSEGVGESNALWLAVRHRPVCRRGQQVSYAAYWGEPLTVRCEVEAEPATPLAFHWRFAAPDAPAAAFGARGLRATATFTPRSERHLGAVFCWANNSAGEQHVPCTFTVFKPVVPNPPKWCRALNRSASGLAVSCEPGYDGGSPQRFVLWGGPFAPLAAPDPRFALRGLPPGAALRLAVAAENKVGRSAPVLLHTSTLSVEPTGSEWSITKTLLLCALLMLLCVGAAGAVAALLRRRSRPFLL